MSEFARYHEITDRLKKRFNLMRKPNLKEASESCRKLSQQLQSFRNYSGYCMYSAAKCEHQIVGSLKEQLNQSIISNNDDNSNRKIDTQSILKSTRTPTSVSSTNRTNHALENLLSEALWSEFRTWLDTARIFSQSDQIEMDNLNAAISAYAHAIQTCPSPRILSVVLIEFASLYRRYHRYYESAELFIEAGQYHDAIDCLLRGHFYQDAYQCYQEMFRKLPNCENFSNLTDAISSTSSSKSAKSSTSNSRKSCTNVPSLQTKSILSLFRKKSPANNNSETKKYHDDQEKMMESIGHSQRYPPFQVNDNNPFDFCENKLTIDDYITFFLLRLYLYDPVKYEYPSPIIPIPKNSQFRHFESENNDQIERGIDDEFISDDNNGDKNASIIKNTSNSLFKTSILSSPFMDSINGQWMDRSNDDIIRLNHLLETLYLSYRNELRSSLDNEYSDYDIIRPTFQQISDNDIIDSNAADDNENDRKDKAVHNKKSNDSDESEITEFADEDDSFSSIMNTTTTSTRYDSKDSSDDDQQQHGSNNLNDGKHCNRPDKLLPSNSNLPISPGLKLLETGELDDIGARLIHLANHKKKLRNPPPSSAKSMIDFESFDEQIETFCRKKFVQSTKQENLNEIISNSNNHETDDDNDNQDEYNVSLRHEIARKLYPLLNCNQIQLLYDILREKD